MNLGSIYLQTVQTRLKDYKSLGDKTFAQLGDSELFYAPDTVSNSIAVIVRHMAGNMHSRWTNFLTEDGEKPWRDRDSEFEMETVSRENLLSVWEKGWEVFLSTIASLSEEDLAKTITIRGQALPVIDAINRQLGHYSYHVGQIVYLGRMIRGESWSSLSIPKGASGTYNSQMMDKKKA
jgi:hypothetical protein